MGAMVPPKSGIVKPKESPIVDALEQHFRRYTSLVQSGSCVDTVIVDTNKEENDLNKKERQFKYQQEEKPEDYSIVSTDDLVK